MNSTSRSLQRLLALSLALVGLAAPSAYAAEFHVGQAHTLLSGTSTEEQLFTMKETHKFGESSVSIHCQRALTGTTTELTETEWSLSPAFAFCEDNLARGTDVSTNECRYVVHATAGTGPYTGDTDLVCPAGKSFETVITNSNQTAVCTLTIGPQSGVGVVDFANESGKVKIQWTVTNLKYTSKGGIFNCGVTDGEHSAGFTGSWLMEAKTTAGTATTVKVE